MVLFCAIVTRIGDNILNSLPNSVTNLQCHYQNWSHYRSVPNSVTIREYKRGTLIVRHELTRTNAQMNSLTEQTF